MALMDRRHFFKAAGGLLGAIVFCPGIVLEELPGIPALPAPDMTVLLTPDLVAREALRILEANLFLAGQVGLFNRGDYVTGSDSGAQGDVIKIRRRLSCMQD